MWGISSPKGYSCCKTELWMILDESMPTNCLCMTMCKPWNSFFFSLLSMFFCFCSANQNSGSSNLPRPFLHTGSWVVTLCCTHKRELKAAGKCWPTFTRHWPGQTAQGGSCKIPSAASAAGSAERRRWSSLWLLSRWITSQYRIMLRWMSEDTMAAPHFWIVQ